MKRFALTISLLCSLGALSGCFNQQVIMDSDYNAVQAVPDHSQVYLHIFGLLGINNRAALDALCPNGAGLVETTTYFAFYFLVIESYNVYCK